MRLARLRGGELLAGLAAVALAVLMSLPWFAPQVTGVVEHEGVDLAGQAHRSGWTSLGWGAVALVGIALLCAAALVVATAMDGALARSVAAAVLCTVAAAVAFLALALRVLVAQPGLGLGLPDSLVSARAPAYLGLLACAVLVGGAVRAMADERTDAPESAYAPPPPRPAPPVGSG